MGLELLHSIGQAVTLTPPDEHHRRFGVPIGGPFDRWSALAGRELLGGRDCEQWEVLGSADFLVHSPGVVACTGAEQEILLDGVRQWKRAWFKVAEGARLRVVGRNRDAARTYLSFGPSGAPFHLAPPPSRKQSVIRYVPGPDAPPFQASAWRVTPNSNRIGVRFTGPAQPHQIELPSRPTTFGSIQVPPDGNPIVLGPEGPTIGGYPQVGVVINADLDAIGQLLPDHVVEFAAVTLEEARAIYREEESRWERWRVMATIGLDLRN